MNRYQGLEDEIWKCFFDKSLEKNCIFLMNVLADLTQSTELVFDHGWCVICIANRHKNLEILKEANSYNLTA